MIGLPPEIISRNIQSPVQKFKITADIKCLRTFPFHIIVCRIADTDSRITEECLSHAIITIGGPIGKSVDITVHTIAGTQFSLHDFLQPVRIKSLLIDMPTSRNSREESISVITSQVRGSIITSTKRQQVFVFVIVINPTEISHHLMRRTRTGSYSSFSNTVHGRNIIRSASSTRSHDRIYDTFGII